MENLNEKVYRTIERLIKGSLWGQTVTEEELIRFLYEEIEEFTEGVRKQDTDNMYEEASDILMLILYIIIKKQKNENENPVSRITRGIDRKLKKRYAVFFEENSSEENEEVYWEKTKYMEKEIWEYLYCSNKDCQFYGKSNEGQLKYSEEKGVQCICGHMGNLCGENVFFPRIKERRKLMTKIVGYCEDFCEGKEFADDHFFLSERKNYIRILRFAMEYPTGYMALQDYLEKKVKGLNEKFTLFLIRPLLRYMEQSTIGRISLLKSDEINSFMISTINKNYYQFKKLFLRVSENAITIYSSYCISLLNGTLTKLQHNGEDCKQDKLTNIKEYITILDEENNKEKTINIAVQTFNIEIDNRVAVTIQTEGECSNFEWLRLIYIVIAKFDVAHNLKNTIFLKGIKEKNLKRHLKDIIKDIFPEIWHLVIFDSEVSK